MLPNEFPTNKLESDYDLLEHLEGCNYDPYDRFDQVFELETFGFRASEDEIDFEK